MAEQVPEIWFSGTRNQPKNEFTSSWARRFFIFLPNLIIFRNSAVSSVCSTLKNHQIWQKIGKKWRKALFNLPQTHFSTVLPKPRFQLPNPSLFSNFKVFFKNNFQKKNLLGQKWNIALFTNRLCFIFFIHKFEIRMKCFMMNFHQYWSETMKWTSGTQ